MSMKRIYNISLAWSASLILLLGALSGCSQDELLGTIDKADLSELRATSAEYVTVVLEDAGTLAGKLGDRKTTIESLKLSGPFNAADVRCIREMSALKNLDMKDVKIVDSDETYGDKKLEKDKIGAYCFSDLNSLATLVLPDNIIEIGEYAFQSTALVSITIPNTVKLIGNNAFYYCRSLVSVVLPKELNKITAGLFNYCMALESIDIPNSVNVIEREAFSNCLSLTSFKIPVGVIAINDYTFNNCKSLVSISIPNTVTTIGYRAFNGCSRLNAIPIPEGVTSLGGGVFDGCSSLTTLTIPASVTKIGDLTTSILPNLTSVFWKTTVGNGLPELDISDNCLVYAYTDAPFHKSWHNIIRGGIANEIVLKDGQAFNCPESFTAKKITFVKNFSLTTGYEESAGWETIVLPFTVQNIKPESSEDARVFTPFKSSQKTDYNFWLRTLESSGFKEVPELQANKPYLIAMPNNTVYAPEYCIKGNIVFSAENVTIEKTPENMRLEGSGFSMLATYQALENSNSRYALNNKGDNRELKWGSAFFPSLRAINPLEAYLMDKGTGLRSIAIPATDGLRTKSMAVKGMTNRKPSINDI